MTNDVPTRSHPHYGTCAGCLQLKHVRDDGLVRDHNSYRVVGAVVSSLRCTGSGVRYLAGAEPGHLSA